MLADQLMFHSCEEIIAEVTHELQTFHFPTAAPSSAEGNRKYCIHCSKLIIPIQSILRIARKNFTSHCVSTAASPGITCLATSWRFCLCICLDMTVELKKRSSPCLSFTNALRKCYSASTDNHDCSVALFQKTKLKASATMSALKVCYYGTSPCSWRIKIWGKENCKRKH